MRNGNKVLIAAAMLVVPTTGTAQIANHASLRIGVFASSQPAYWPGVGLGLAYQPAAAGYDGYYNDGSYNDGYYNDGSYNDGYYNDGSYHDGYYHDGYHPGRGYSFDCWDPFWWDLLLDCRYYPVGYLSYTRWSWHSPSWGWFGFLGWPSRRYVREHWYAASPYWGSGYDWGYPGYRDYYGYAGRYGYGRGSRYGYGSRTDRIVRHSPLFGPRYKENPRVYVTDNGPERPTSRAVPRGDRADLVGAASPREGRGTIGDRKARPRTDTDTRTARPQVRARPEVPRATSRPGSTRPSTRSTPNRTRTPVVRTGPGTARTTPGTVRSNPRSAPRVQPTPRKRFAPQARPAAPRRSPPKARPAAPRRSPPKVGSSGPRRSPPKVRPAPKRSPPKARPAPKRSPPKAPPKRSGPSRRRGGSI